MTCNAIYWEKARIKSKTTVAQTASQVAVYAKGLISLATLFFMSLVLYFVWHYTVTDPRRHVRPTFHCTPNLQEPCEILRFLWQWKEQLLSSECKVKQSCSYLPAIHLDVWVHLSSARWRLIWEIPLTIFFASLIHRFAGQVYMHVPSV
jgi:hypothetical protein